MKRRLIIDCGSTKADWALTDGGRRYGQCRGLNAAMADEATVADFVAATPVGGDGEVVDEVWMYGAGCLPGAPSQRVAAAFEQAAAIGPESISVTTDMLGAARALLGHERGVACVLGTGSNSCVYDGECITGNIPSLGYVLGDEGSGNHMGRTLLTAYFKRLLDKSLAEAFAGAYPQLDVAGVIDRVYRQPGANTWLASFTRFLGAHISHPAADALVTECLEAFADRCILPYGAAVCAVPIAFVGSVAKAFEPQLRRVLASRGLKAGRVIDRPIEALADYHDF